MWLKIIAVMLHLERAVSTIPRLSQEEVKDSDVQRLCVRVLVIKLSTFVTMRHMAT